MVTALDSKFRIQPLDVTIRHVLWEGEEPLCAGNAIFHKVVAQQKHKATRIAICAWARQDSCPARPGGGTRIRGEIINRGVGTENVDIDSEGICSTGAYTEVDPGSIP